MVQLPKLDNSWLQSSAPKKASSNASLFGESRAEKVSSPANDTSATSVENKSPFSSQHDFNSTLKNKLAAPKDDKRLEEREPSSSEISDDTAEEAPVSLSDSDTSTQSAQPAINPALLKMKATAPKQEASPMQAMDHRLAWNSFIHKMKEKLGVSAQDLLAAFKSLTKEELMQPPEQNIEKLVQQLGLNDQQMAMARQFFKELIVRTDAQPLQKDAKLATDGGPLAVMNQREARDHKMQTSLQKMNQQFFMKAPAQAEKSEALDTKKDLAAISSGEKSEDARPAQAEGIAIPAELMNSAKDNSIATPNLENLQKVAPQASNEPKKSFVKPAIFEQTEDVTANSTPSVTTAAFSNAPKFATKNAISPTPNFDTAANINPTAVQTPVAPMPVIPTMPTFGNSPEKGHDDSSDDSVDGMMMDADDAAIGQQQGAFSLNGSSDAQAAKELKNAMPTMAAPELVQQAQVMVKDGGGEMKVVLTPDGLGEVAMKVSVKDGKVSVEMVTQSEEAKKIIQDSFHALRDGLNTHHLNLDTIKVDTAQNLSTQLEQQYRDAQRNQAQQFLENFHQDNRNWRQSYFDIPGAQLYRSQSQRPSMGAPVNASSKTSGSRRLDLVA